MKRSDRVASLEEAKDQFKTSWEARESPFSNIATAELVLAFPYLNQKAGMEDAMKLRYALAMAALSSVAVGTAVHTLHAQAKPPVYMVAMNEITDQEGYTKQYLPTAQKTLKDHGGVYVAAGPGTQVDGSLPKGRVVILRWESMEALNGWRHSPEYEAIRKVGEGFAKYNVVAVDGVKQ